MVATVRGASALRPAVGEAAERAREGSAARIGRGPCLLLRLGLLLLELDGLRAGLIELLLDLLADRFRRQAHRLLGRLVAAGDIPCDVEIEGKSPVRILVRLVLRHDS